MTIQAVVAQAQTLIKAALPKIKTAPAYPNDSPISIGSSQALAENIRFNSYSAGVNSTLFDLRIDIVIPMKSTEDAFKWLEGIPEAIAAVFTANPTISGTCSTYGDAITANLQFKEIDGTPVIGYVIIVPDIKLM